MKQLIAVSGKALTELGPPVSPSVVQGFSDAFADTPAWIPHDSASRAIGSASPHARSVNTDATLDETHTASVTLQHRQTGGALLKRMHLLRRTSHFDYRPRV